MEKGIITIGRQYGSQGRAVGKMLAQRLGCAFYDKEELARIARGRDYEEVRELDVYKRQTPGRAGKSWSQVRSLHGLILWQVT